MGPLDGVRVIEIASLAPAPFGCMVLSDLGADVLRVDRLDRAGRQALPPVDPLARGRRSIRLNLKDAEGAAVLLRLIADADVLVEGFRPGVAERLGFGPDVCLERNPRLVFARMTGWGQDGPLAATAGHDIDYIAVAGSLYPIGRAGERPVPPLNLVGDFGGGGMLLAVGVLAALLERERSGRGQVIDAAMVDGSALLASFIHGLRAAGAWQDERGSNVLDGGAPFYDTYETADGEHMAVGALEPKFYDELLTRLGLDSAGLPGQYDRSGWPACGPGWPKPSPNAPRPSWSSCSKARTPAWPRCSGRGTRPAHPHNAARGTFINVGGVIQPAPAPRFGRTPCATPAPPARPGADTDAVLAGLGFSPAEVIALRDRGIAS